MLKAKVERKISKSKNLRNFDLLGALEIRVYEKLRFVLQKAHLCVNPRRLSHFAWRLVGGLTSRGEPEKNRVTRGSQRNDVSPLAQGLRYRAACETSQTFHLTSGGGVTWRAFSSFSLRFRAHFTASSRAVNLLWSSSICGNICEYCIQQPHDAYQLHFAT